MSKQPLIVGVDPGSTSAVAAINLEGDPQLLESSKNFPPNQIIGRIIDAGKPVVVTSDKAKMPSKVDKIASSIGAETFVPDNDLGQQEKKDLGQGDNSHEKDAMASAVNAYNNLQREIKKIERYTHKTDLDKAVVADRYFSEDPIKRSEQEEKEEETRNEESRPEPEVDPEKQRMKDKIENLENQIDSLKSEMGEMEAENERLRGKLEQLREQDREKILKEREITRREALIKEKNEKIDELEEELENTSIRERQYRKALENLSEGGELIEIVTRRTDEVPDKSLTRSKGLQEELEAQGFNIRHIDEVEAIELERFAVVEEFPKAKNFHKIIDEYRESR